MDSFSNAIGKLLKITDQRLKAMMLCKDPVVAAMNDEAIRFLEMKIPKESKTPAKKKAKKKK
jgi:hypothetical protein